MFLPDWEKNYLHDINRRRLELAKNIKPRDRRGRKPKVTTSNVPPEVGSEVDVVAVEDAHVEEEDGESLRPKRTASNQHAGLGKFVFGGIFSFINFSILILILFLQPLNLLQRNSKMKECRSRRSEQYAILAKTRKDFLKFCEGNYEFLTYFDFDF